MYQAISGKNQVRSGELGGGGEYKITSCSVWPATHFRIV